MISSKKAISVLYFILFIHCGFCQILDTTLANFQYYQYQVPEEKVYLSTDKEVFVQNEHLWFSVFLVDAKTHQTSSISKLVYVDLLGPKDQIISSLAIDMKSHLGKGSFFLADSLLAGNYTINAYTNYMRNGSSEFIFSKTVEFFNLKRKSTLKESFRNEKGIHVDFFPEGGYIISGVPNIIAFKIIDDSGNGLIHQGMLIDSSGNEIMELNPLKFGLGKFQFTPESGQDYSGFFQINGKEYFFKLPKAQEKGYQLTVRKTLTKTYITVKGSPGMSFKNTYLLMHIRGNIIKVVKSTLGQEFIYNSLVNDQVPSGIIHITFFKEDIPLLERLIYNEIANDKINIAIDVTPNIKKRSKVNFDLNVLDPDDLKSSGSFSVSVQKKSTDRNKINIENYLWLTSDLIGSIESPNYYTNVANLDRFEMLDLLMLTHGWRRFDWDNVLNKTLPPILYFPEKGFTLEGKVVRWEDRSKPIQADLSMTFFENINFQLKTSSNEAGDFWFEGLQVEDTLNALIQTVNPKKGRKGKLTNSFIEIKKKTYPKLRKNPPSNKMESEILYRDYLDDMLEIAQIKASYDGDVIFLDEVAVESTLDRSSNLFYREYMLYREPDTRLIVDSIKTGYANIFDVIKGRLTGVQFSKDENGNYIALVRGANSISLDNNAVFLLDGQEMSSSVISTINPNDISHVDVLKGTRATIYGTPNGVIAFYRKTGRSGVALGNTMGILNVEMYGYHQPDEFYVPNYKNPTEIEKIRPDRRGTQYWCPTVSLNQNKASFSYYTSDDSGDFVVYIEGLTHEGRLIRSEVNFKID
tara:strand:+ start:7205 stop:9625 length:2421 start_codon:yes stop_codon:yes gene_type:complete